MKLLCAFLLVLASSPILAAELKKTRSGKKIVQLKDDEVLEGSSADYRLEKRFSLTWEMFGLTPYSSSGAAIGFYLNPDNILELSRLNTPGIDNSHVTSLRLKTFWGNSFYTNIGAGLRKADYRDTATPGDISASPDWYNHYAAFKTTVLGLDFAIGNRWQWDYFTIGCDWIGMFSPLKGTAQTKVTYDADVPEEEKGKYELDYYSRNAAPQLLRFYLGVSF